MIIKNTNTDFMDNYLKDDWVTDFLDQNSFPEDEELTCQKWLRNTPPKRAIYANFYGDLIKSERPHSVLDIGGGLTCGTRFLAQRHQYKLVDILAHDTLQAANKMERSVGRPFLFKNDWFELAAPERYDVVIANDIFPNVDQRLEIFLSRFLPRCRELRISLTFYNESRFYMTKRINGDEILTVLAWDQDMLNDALSRLGRRSGKLNVVSCMNIGGALYENGRSVCLLRLRGDVS